MAFSQKIFRVFILVWIDGKYIRNHNCHEKTETDKLFPFF